MLYGYFEDCDVMSNIKEKTNLNVGILAVLFWEILICYGWLGFGYYFDAFNISIIGIGLVVFLPDSLGFHKFAQTVVVITAIIVGVQLATVVASGHYLNMIELDNIYEIRHLDSKIMIKSLGVMGSLLLGLAVIMLMFRHRFWKVSKIGLYLFMLVSLPIVVLNVWIAQALPIYNFWKISHQYALQVVWQVDNSISDQQRKLYGKEWVYQSDDDKIDNLSGKNIVVLFSEGLSLNLIDKFNKFSGLTPNMTDFVNKGLFIDNYYNHTATTYRGLVGQMSSGYFMQGGEQMNPSSNIVALPDILRNYNYHSYFLSALDAKHPLNQKLKKLHFDKVFGVDDYLKNKDILADDELFSFLEHLMTDGKLQEPYFIGVYPRGAHWGNDSAENQYENGKNKILNVLHNYDYWFGKFVKNIQSKDADGKIAILLTADHAIFQSDEYNHLFEDSRDNFIDKIPFVLYYRGITHKTIDAECQNSLSFAPTLLQWMRIKTSENYFLGCSLFDEKCKSDFARISAYGDEFFTTDKCVVKKITNSKNTLCNKVKDFYHFSEASDTKIEKWINVD